MASAVPADMFRGMAFSFSPSLVIFDCDGVLVDTEPVGGRVFAEGAIELGYPASFDECLHTFRGRSMMSAVEIIEARMGCPVPDGWADEMWRRTEQAFAGGVESITGAVEAVSHIHKHGIPFCLASSGEMKRRLINQMKPTTSGSAATAPHHRIVPVRISASPR